MKERRWANIPDADKMQFIEPDVSISLERNANCEYFWTIVKFKWNSVKLMLHTQSFSINSPLTDRDNLITISFLTKWKNLDFSLQTEVSRFLAIHGLFRYFHPYSFFRTRFVAEKQRSVSPFLPRIELSSIAIDINLLESKWMETSKHQDIHWSRKALFMQSSRLHSHIFLLELPCFFLSGNSRIIENFEDSLEISVIWLFKQLIRPCWQK